VPSTRPGDLDGWWRLGLALVAPLAAATFRLRVTGERSVPVGAAVLAANHVSGLDGPVLAVVTGMRARRMTRFLVAAEFFDKRSFGWALRLYRQIPLHRGAGDAGALSVAIDTVERGALAGIFPEGRVSADPGTGLQRVRTGVSRIALAARAPVVPVGIWGTQRRWPLSGLHARRPYRPVVAVAYGEPIEPVGDAADAYEVDAFGEVVRAALERQVAIATSIAGPD
jgi:1-acyl-sn-glycerol-3-phosphate acyltransferase